MNSVMSWVIVASLIRLPTARDPFQIEVPRAPRRLEMGQMMQVKRINFIVESR